MGHLGIELRVSVNGQPVILADSVRLHLIAKFAGYGGWHNLLSPIDGPATVVECHPGHLVPIPITVEVKAVELSDPADYEHDQEDDDDEAADSPDQEAQADHR